ncbi:putative O-methyltransferase [Xylariaceae sp. FL0016]|nr:putative O-methyltransferase [Xylariaceae sp. FL0016]
MTSSVSEIVASLDQITLDDVQGNDDDRHQIIAAARRLLNNLVKVPEQTYRMVFEEPNAFASLMTCVDLGLFKTWTEFGGGEKSLDDLVGMCKYNCESNLLRRLLRLLVCMGYIQEIGEDRYGSTPFSLALGEKNALVAESLYCRRHLLERATMELPAFLAANSYQEPVDSKETPYAFSDPEKRDFFTACVQNPMLQEAFSGFMTLWTKSKYPWPTYYDIEALIQGADMSNAPLIVDLGGHHGVDLGLVLDKHPSLPVGSLVLQDLPVVVEGAAVSLKSNNVFRIMGHDIFEPQPIVGARAYFAHAVFHDWPDNRAIEILTQTKAAMRKGYSKLLICDIAIPATGATSPQATMDIGMMITLSGSERTEFAWKGLLAEAGFKIIKFWRDPMGYEALIEAELE